METAGEFARWTQEEVVAEFGERCNLWEGHPFAPIHTALFNVALARGMSRTAIRRVVDELDGIGVIPFPNLVCVLDRRAKEVERGHGH